MRPSLWSRNCSSGRLPVAIIFFFLCISALASTLTEIETPQVHQYWISASIGSDSNDGSIEAPFKTLAKALSTSDNFVNQIFYFHFSPGIYNLTSWMAQSKAVYNFSQCVECPHEPDNNAQDVTLGVNANSVGSLPAIISASTSTMAFYNLRFTTLPDSLDEIPPLDVLFTSSKALHFENVEFTNFHITPSSLRPAALVVTRGYSVTTYKNVHWHHNIVNVTQYTGESFFAYHSLAHQGHIRDKVTFEDCLYEDNLVVAYTIEGGMMGLTGATQIYRSVFRNNVISGLNICWGTIISVPVAGSLVVEDSQFLSNTLICSDNAYRGIVTAAGGAIHMHPSSSANITRSTFEQNSAFAGGAIAVIFPGFYERERGDLNISHCVFKSNIAQNVGSAIFIEASKSMSPAISDSTFNSNLVSDATGLAYIGAYSPSAIFIHNARARVDLFNLIFTRKTDFLKSGFHACYRTSIYGSPRVSIEQMTYLSVSVRYSEGGLLYLLDNIDTVISKFVFSFVLGEGSRDLMSSLILVDSGLDPESTRVSLTLRDVSLGPLNVMASENLFHFRNIHSIDIHHFAAEIFHQDSDTVAVFIHNVFQVSISDSLFVNSEFPITIQEAAVVKFSNLVMRGTQRVRGYLIDISSTDLTTFDQVTFDNTRNSVRIRDVFRLSVTNSTWRDCHTEGSDGAALYLMAVHMSTISHSRFLRNLASNGGAIYTSDEIDIKFCEFTNNTASIAGGALYGSNRHNSIQDSNFTGNVAPVGGAVYIQGSDATVTGCHFIQNEATSSSGGAIQFLASQPKTTEFAALVVSSLFIGNMARISGGAIDMGAGYFLLGLDSQFIGNVAGPKEILNLNTYQISEFQQLFGRGGAIHGGGGYQLAECRFVSNLADSGAGLYVEWSETPIYQELYIFDSFFEQNTAAHSGGAITVNVNPRASATIISEPTADIRLSNINNTVFIGNNAYYYGGAIASLGSRLNLSCGQNLFLNSTAKYGGALYYDQGSIGVPAPVIRSHFFSNNRALAGAIAFISHINDTFANRLYSLCTKFNSCTRNSAQGYGDVAATARFNLGWISQGETKPHHHDNPPMLPWPIDAPQCTIPRHFIGVPNRFIEVTPELRNAIDNGGHEMNEALFDLRIQMKRTSQERFRIAKLKGLIDEETEVEEAINDSSFSHLDYLSVINNYQQIVKDAEEYARKLSTLGLHNEDAYMNQFGIDSDFASLEVDLEVDEPIRSEIGKKEAAIRKASAPNDHWNHIFGPIMVHSGITETVLFQASDQIGQKVIDERAFPLALKLQHSSQDCSSDNHCGNVTFVPIGNTPAMLAGMVSLDINLVLDEMVEPHQEVFINLTGSFSALSGGSPMSWLSKRYFIVMLSIRDCPPGYGFLNSREPFCQICPYSTFNLNGNGICASCSNDNKLQCYGDTLLTEDDYWIYSDKTTNKASAYLCPSGYCFGKSNNCAPHRTGRLCAACEEGYSESLFSACTKCNKPNWGLLLLAFILLWAAILIIHTIVAASSGKSTILFYFVQTAAMFVSDIPFPLKTSDPNSSLCLFPMTPLSRKLVFMLLPVIMMIQILLTFGIHRIFVSLIRPLLPERYQLRSNFYNEWKEFFKKRRGPKTDGEETRLLDDDSLQEDASTTDVRKKLPTSSKLAKVRGRVDSFSSDEPSFVEEAYLANKRHTRSRSPSDESDNVMDWGIQPVRARNTRSDSSENRSGSSSSSDTSSSSRSSVVPISPDSPDLVFLAATKHKKEKAVLLGTENSPDRLVSGEMSSSDAASEDDSEMTDDEFDRHLGVRPKLSAPGFLSDSNDLSPSYDSDNSISDLRIPAFGFEMSDEEEEENLDAELPDWNVGEDDSDEPRVLLKQEKAIRDMGKLMPGSKAGQEQLPTLGALRRWMYEKRFFHHYRLIRTLMALTTFSFSSISSYVFTVFDCLHLRGTHHKFLRSQPDLICGSPEMNPWKYGAISLIPLSVIIFIAISYKLFSGYFKRQLTQSDVRFGIFYEMYKSSFFFWKIIELVRRVALTAIFVFLNEQEFTRGIYLATACFVILGAQALAWPYRRKLENSLETFSTFILSVISIASIWHSKAVTSAASIVIWLLIFLTTTIIIIAFSVSVFRRRIFPWLKNHLPTTSNSQNVH